MKNNFFTKLKNVFWSMVYQRSYQATVFENLLRETCDRKLKDVPKCLGLIEEVKKNPPHVSSYDLTPYQSEPKQFLYKDISVVTFGNKETAERMIYFIHGGGWLFDFDPVHFVFCDKLAKDLNAFVIAPSYLLAPHYSFNQSVPTLLELYDEIVQKFDRPIIMMGDSAGGQISLSITMMAYKQKMKLPNQVVAISPVVDASMSINPSLYDRYEKKDPILGKDCLPLIAKIFAPDFELTDYRISPYFFCEMSFLPPITLVVGTHEIFYPDVCSFYKKITSAGVKSKLIAGKGLSHDFVIYNDLPESKQVYQQIVDEIKNLSK